MISNLLMFYLFSAVIVTFAILSVTSRKILRAATYLLFVLVSTGGLYFMLNFNFLAAVQLTLYAGGIVVLIIFSILLTSQIADKLEIASLSKTWLAALLTLGGAGMTLFTILSYHFPEKNPVLIQSDIHTIGLYFMNYGEGGYALPFEVISILLLAAMIGAIIIAKRKIEQPK
jgi:NADH-quinone oxidoreductase subunit J